MTISPIAFAKERARQKTARDSNFLKRLLYFFELDVPASASLIGDTSYLFPLIIPPTNYTLEEPFAVESTKTQGGGLYVEENGIVERIIRIQGHTGFAPREVKNIGAKGGFVPAMFLTGVESSFSRALPKTITTALSGQRHFQYLQDAVFRTYADLKRDPATSEGTVLKFHNPRDEEAWIVVPTKFTLERNVDKRFLYNYNIELLVVEKATLVKKDFSPDKSWIDKMKDGLRMAKKGLDLAAGAVRDLTALQANIKNTIKNINVILDGVTNIIRAATDFVDGTTELIQLPYSTLESTIELISEATNLVSSGKDLENEIEAFPENVLQKIRTLEDACEILGTNPSTWETPAEESIRKIREQQSARLSFLAARRAAGLGKPTPTVREGIAENIGGELNPDNFPTPTSFDEVNDLGTGLTSGDVESMDGEITVGGEIVKFRSGRVVPIEDGDTLLSLAAKYMDDARLWQYIAIINGLKPPFVDRMAAVPLTNSNADEQPFGEALGVGSYIVIPSYAQSTLDLPLLPVLGASLDEGVEAQLLGSDFKLEAVGSGKTDSTIFYDIPVNTELGSTDAVVVSGMANMEQVVLLRLSIERGTDIMYRGLGLRRIIGMTFDALELEYARFRIAESIITDPRIMNVLNIDFTQEDDKFITELDAVVRGFPDPRPVAVEL